MGCGHIQQNYWVDTVGHWSHRLLTERNVDAAAVTDWCALYAASAFRKSQALELLHKMLKKEHGGYGVRNPSAFLATAIKDAWHQEEQWW